MVEKFCLKWNDFQTNVSNTFRKLRTSDHFYDVTLVSDDQQQVSAHKVILSSSSEYFRNVLTSTIHSHPMLCLSGVSKTDLMNILEFIYNGEIQIIQDNLDHFLDIAQRFKLEGLIREKEEHPVETQMFDDKNFQENIMTQNAEKVIVKSQKTEKIIVFESANFDNMEALDQKLSEMLEGNGRSKICIPCGKISRDMTDAKLHAETHIDGLNFPCQHCDKSFRTRKAFRSHMDRYHRQ